VGEFPDVDAPLPHVPEGVAVQGLIGMSKYVSTRCVLSS
jgi:hypothetical protein